MDKEKQQVLTFLAPLHLSLETTVTSKLTQMTNKVIRIDSFISLFVCLFCFLFKISVFIDRPIILVNPNPAVCKFSTNESRLLLTQSQVLHVLY